MTKFEVKNLWDLIQFIGTTYPQEDIYLNVVGEMEDEEFHSKYPNFVQGLNSEKWEEEDKLLSDLVDMWYKCNNVNWWGKCGDIDMMKE
jgi:hypothetical protein